MATFWRLGHARKTFRASIVVAVPLLAAVVVALSLVLAAQASASWTAAAGLTGSKNVRGTAVAVNTRGDAAVGWFVDPSFLGRSGDLQVRVAYRRGWGGRFSVRTVLRRGGLTARNLTLALDKHGQLSVAWIDQAVTKGSLHGRKTVRGVYRTPSGRWSSVQAIGSASPFWYAATTLAVAPNGTVLLTYNARSIAAPGMAAVWRSPGHRFGSVRALPTGRGGLLQEPTTLFDSAGRAYVAGVLDCDSSSSRGVLMTAEPGSHRFSAMRTVAPKPAHHLHLVLTAPGRSALVWRRVGCSTSEDLAGPVYGASLSSAKAGTPALIDPQSGDRLWLSGAPLDTADAAWTAFPESRPEAVLLASRLDDAGSWTAPLAPTDGWVAVKADAIGNQAVQKAQPLASDFVNAVGARSATDAIEPAPIAGSPFSAAGATTGAGLVIAATGDSKLTVATWRP